MLRDANGTMHSVGGGQTGRSTARRAEGSAEVGSSDRGDVNERGRIGRRQALGGILRVTAAAAVASSPVLTGCGLVGPERAQGTGALTLLSGPNALRLASALTSAYGTRGTASDIVVQVAEPSLVSVLQGTTRNAPAPSYDMVMVRPSVRTLTALPSLLTNLAVPLKGIPEHSQITPALWSYATANARLLFAPMMGDPLTVFYNGDALERSGINAPVLQWSLEEFVANCQQLANRLGPAIVPIADVINTFNPELFTAFVVGFGGQVLSANSQTALFASSQALAGIQALVSLHAFEPPSASPSAITLFTSGKAVLYFGHLSEIATLTTMIGDLFAWNAAPLPTFPVAGAVVPMQSSGIGIGTWSDRTRAALDFLEYTVSPAGQQVIAGIGPEVPALPAAAASWRPPSGQLRTASFLPPASAQIAVPWALDQLPQVAAALQAVVAGTSLTDAFQAAATEANNTLLRLGIP